RLRLDVALADEVAILVERQLARDVDVVADAPAERVARPLILHAGRSDRNAGHASLLCRRSRGSRSAPSLAPGWPSAGSPVDFGVSLPASRPCVPPPLRLSDLTRHTRRRGLSRQEVAFGMPATTYIVLEFAWRRQRTGLSVFVALLDVTPRHLDAFLAAETLVLDAGVVLLAQEVERQRFATLDRRIEVHRGWSRGRS